MSGKDNYPKPILTDRQTELKFSEAKVLLQKTELSQSYSVPAVNAKCGEVYLFATPDPKKKGEW